jgi:general secretion pathway protein D
LKATAPWLAGLAALSVTVTSTPGRAAPLVAPALTAASVLGQSGSGGLLPLVTTSREASRPEDPFAAARRRDEAFNRLTNTEREQARTYLEKGRAAIAQGDATAALHWYRKAKSTAAEFAPGEYSPRELAEALRQAGVPPQELAAAPQVPAMPPITPEQAAAADRSVLPALLQSRASGDQSPFAGQVITNPHLIPVNDHPLIGNTPAAVGAGAEPRVGDFGGAIRRLPSPTQENKDAGAGANVKAAALRLVAEARAAMDRGDLPAAHRLASQARDLQVPDTAFAAGETRPWTLLLQVESEMNRRGQAVVPAGAVLESNSTSGGYPVQRALHQPANDNTRNALAANLQAGPAPPAAAPGQPNPGRELYEAGLNALQRQDRETALKYFRDAWKYEATLDPMTRQRLKDHLGGLQATAPRPAPAAGEPGHLEPVSAEELAAFQRMSREMNVEIREAEALMNRDPLGGLQRVKTARERVLNSDLSPRSRKQLLVIVDRTLEKMEKYIDENRANIELNAQSKATLQQIDRERAMRLASQERLAQLVEEFNSLIDQERWPEAERIAMQAHEIAPHEEVVASMIWKSRFIKAYESRRALQSRKEQGFMAAMTSVEESTIPFDDRDPFQFGDATRWSQLSKTRRQWLQEQGRRLSPNELRIQDVLKEPVDVRFNNQPLSEVMDILSAAVGVNFHLNEEGLAAEGASSDMPVECCLVDVSQTQDRPRADRRPAGRSCAVCRTCRSRSRCGSSRSRQLLRADRRRLRLRHRRQLDPDRRRPATRRHFGPSMVAVWDPTVGHATADGDLVVPSSRTASARRCRSSAGSTRRSAANFGFAILSDIEVFFLLQAARATTPTNVLQAPKVTLFNGQRRSSPTARSGRSSPA